MNAIANHIVNVVIRRLALFALLLFVAGTTALKAQEHDVRGERLVVDDNGTDSTVNTVTIRALSTLSHDFILTIPDPGTDTAEFMLSASPGAGAGFWGLGGNSGTVPGSSFLGTSDSAALQLQVTDGAGMVANSLILNDNGALQRDTGGNARGTGAVDLQIARTEATEVAVSHYSVIAGGADNGMESTNGTYTTIRGGAGNVIRSNKVRYATIAGGLNGEIGTSEYAAIGGGGGNVIDTLAYYATIAGGKANVMEIGSYSVIGGGGSNYLTYGLYETIMGGEGNEMYFPSGSAVISGGGAHRIYSSGDVVIGGGYRNQVNASSGRSTIRGGNGNIVDLGCWGATINGGGTSWIRRRTYFPNESYSTIGGGRGHTIGQGRETSDAINATVAGGAGQVIGVSGANSTIGGGRSHWVDDVNSVVPGGRSLTLNGKLSFGFLANDGSYPMKISETDVAVFGNVNMWLANNTNSPSRLRLYEPYDTTGPFPGSAHYTSFRAPALADTITYILPASKPGATGQVLAVSAINGDIVTLTWKTDNTATDNRADAVPTAIAVPDDNSRQDIRLSKLEEEFEAQERRFVSQEAELHTLLKTIRMLKEGEGVH